MEFGTISTSPGPVDGLQIAVAASTRTLDVVIRSAVAATLEGAEVFLIAGRHRSTTSVTSRG